VYCGGRKARIMNLKENIQLISTSIKALGLLDTTKAVLAHLLTYRPRNDRSFDKKYGTDTAAGVEQDDLQISNEVAKKNAVYYVAAPVKLERYIIGGLPVDYSQYDFVDIGSGKGRVLMIASDFAFRSIAGVEISQKLCELARKNLAIYRAHRRSAKPASHESGIHCLDARDFVIRNENTVFHFYHPFGEDILRTILSNIRSTFQNSSKKVFIVYIWTYWALPSLFPVFEEFGLKRVRFEQTTNPNYNFCVYSS
jgi:SAM-dependent methyltransferase